MKIKNHNIKRILIIKLRGIGDIVLSTIVIPELRKSFPDAKIDYLVETGAEAVGKLDEVNEVLKANRKTLQGKLETIKKVRKNRYDLVLDFYSNPFTAQLTYLSGARCRAGFPYRGRKYAYNYFGPSERDKYHAADLHVKVLNNIGLPSNSKQLLFGISEEDRIFAEKFYTEKFNGSEKVSVLIPGGGWASKRCEPEKFAEFGNLLLDTYGGSLLILWGPGDEEDADLIQKFLYSGKTVKAPLTSLGQMAALIEKAFVVISNDSGPMHIASTTSTPVLGLFGPTNPSLQGPYGEKNAYIRKEDLECIGCNLLECPYNHECFQQLQAADVLDRIKKMLNNAENV